MSQKKKLIGRRRFLKHAAAGVAASATFGPVYAQTNKRVRWRMATSWPKLLDTIYGGAELLARRVKELTQGRFIIEVYPGGELTPALEVLDAGRKGKVEMGHTASYYYTRLHPAFSFGTALPFGLTPRQQNAWLLEGGGEELLNRELYGQFGVLGFAAGNTGVQMGGWFRFPVDRIEDIRGIRMRIPGLGGQVMKNLGVRTVTLPAANIVPALKAGTLDAAEWIGPYDDEKLGFYEAARYYYYPGWWEPGTTIHAFVNQRAWDRLPAAFKTALKAATSEANTRVLADYDQKNPLALERLLKKGVQLRPFSNDFLSLAFREAEALTQGIAAENPLYAKIYEHWNRHRVYAFRWFSTNERLYARFTFDRF